MHAAVCKRFDKLCQKASSITGGVAELQSRLLAHKDGEAEKLRARVLDEAATIMCEWDNDWEVAKLRTHFGLREAQDPSAVIDGQEGFALGHGGILQLQQGFELEQWAAMQTGLLEPEPEPEQPDEPRGSVMFHSTTSFNATLRSEGGASVASVGLSSNVASERFMARQTQLSFELALAAAAQAALHATSNSLRASATRDESGSPTTAAQLAAQHLGQAEQLLAEQDNAPGGGRGDTVLAYRWYRLCTAFADVGDEQGTRRAFVRAFRCGLHLVGNTDVLDPSTHPSIVSILQKAGGNANTSTGTVVQSLERLMVQFREAQREHTASISAISSLKRSERQLYRDLGNTGPLNLDLEEPAPLHDDPATATATATADADADVDANQATRAFGADAPSLESTLMVPIAPAKQQQQHQSEQDSMSDGPRERRRNSQKQSDDSSEVARAARAQMPPRPKLAEALKQSRLAADPGKWSVDDVVDWLAELGLPVQRYQLAFRKENVDGDTLLTLKDRDLVDLQVDVLGHRKLIIKAAGRLKMRGLAELDSGWASASSRGSTRESQRGS